MNKFSNLKLRKISEELDVKWVEYWDFLGCYCNLKTPEGLSKLECYLMQKKVENILREQIKSCESIKTTLNLAESTEFALKLEQIMQQIKSLREELCLTEYSLSEKFERTQLIKDKFKEYKEKKIQQLFNNPNLLHELNNHVEFLNTIQCELKLDNLNEKIQSYFKEITDTITVDESAGVYFSLYKSAKLVIQLLNYKEFVKDFYLTSYFKNLELQPQNKNRSQVNDGDILKIALKNLKIDDKFKADVDLICEKLSNNCFIQNEEEKFESMFRRQNLNNKVYSGVRKPENGYDSNEESKISEEEKSFEDLPNKVNKSENISKYIHRVSSNDKLTCDLFIFG